MEKEQIKQVLEQHEIWLNSGGKSGKKANFQGVCFLRIDLQGVNLQGVNFQNVDLHGANFQGADLENANFQDANLQGANFQGVNFLNANLTGANLTNADLQGSNLLGANLQGSNLLRANFKGAKNLELAILDDNQKKELGLNKDHFQDQAEKNIKDKNRITELGEKLKVAEGNSADKEGLEKELKELENIREEKKQIEKEKNKLEEENLEKQEEALGAVIEKISKSTPTSKNLLKTYKRQSLALLSIASFLYIISMVAGYYIYQGIDIGQPIQNFYIFSPTLLLSFIATALLRHDWKIRQLSVELINQQNITETATGILEASLNLQVIDGVSDNILEESFNDMRSALLFSKKTNKDGVKDNESLEKIVMNAVTKATK